MAILLFHFIVLFSLHFLSSEGFVSLLVCFYFPLNASLQGVLQGSAEGDLLSGCCGGFLAGGCS